MKKLLDDFFYKLNLFLVWLIWYVAAFTMCVLMDFWLVDKTDLTGLWAAMSIFFASFGTLVIYASRKSQKAWEKLRDFESRLYSCENATVLDELSIELGELFKESTGIPYYSELKTLRYVMDIKKKYITEA